MVRGRIADLDKGLERLDLALGGDSFGWLSCWWAGFWVVDAAVWSGVCSLYFLKELLGIISRVYVMTERRGKEGRGESV